ncbi:unnamed protein product [Ostreobium quekettii]|uniref:cyclin-dependent kinase n=1 Tax=Ostreobium quekettii TaxID=121088 RepID=A0A8S1JHF4_9CHLO|nr:unnamed protein product [Ostreobium quekettii]|eukprot:evm.model.scf_1968.1 EVM.evm.TU.scf_1968.1   scf_1968:21987-27794(+)
MAPPPAREIFDGKYVLVEGRGKIGGGAYGEVFLYRDAATGELVAVKRCRIAPSDDPGELWGERMATCAIREASVLEELKQAGGHENIIGFKGVNMIEDRSYMLLAFEYMETSLCDFMMEFHARDVYDGRVPKVLLLQMLKAVSYLHSRRIMHRDLKPANVMVDREKLRPCLLDFGLARGFNLPAQRYSPEVVTSYYRAPELLLGAKQYDAAVDMWSIGCIFAEMVNGEVLFLPRDEEPQEWAIFRIMGVPDNLPQVLNLEGTPRPNFDTRPPIPLQEVVPRLMAEPHGIDLLSRMLTYPPGERISADDALEHLYFQDLPADMRLGIS